MKFGEHVDKIVNEIDAEMKKVIEDDKNVGYLKELKMHFKAILTPVPFADSNEPVPGLNIDHPTFLKSHLLFDFHLQFRIERFETLGGIDEQNIESTHPVFNQLLWRYGSTRGEKLRKQVIRQFLFDWADFVVELVNDMLGGTSKTKRKDAKKRGRTVQECVVIEDKSEEEVSFELTAFEMGMNANTSLWPRDVKALHNADTWVSACARCGKKVLNFGLVIHDHEYHSG
ncbi:hypothetical protein ACHAWF_015152 [Thalassiosira exigua]